MNPDQRAEYGRARPMAHALADAMQRWDDEGDDDATFQEAYKEGWSLSEFIALALVRDGWTFEAPHSDGDSDMTQDAESARGISEEQRVRCIEIHESMIRKNEARIREHRLQIVIIEEANDVRRHALALLLNDGTTHRPGCRAEDGFPCKCDLIDGTDDPDHPLHTCPTDDHADCLFGAEEVDPWIQDELDRMD